MGGDVVSQAAARTNFSAWDAAIIAGYLVASVVVGLLVRRRVRGMAGYLAAGRQVGTWLGIATLTGTEMGLVTIMYAAQKGFKGGFAAFHIGVIAGLVTLLVGLTGLIVAPLRRMRVLTIPEFYERRFGRPVRVLGGVLLACGGILNMGMFLKVASMFVVGVTGISAEAWALPVVMTLLLAAALAYTVVGGMVSVVVTDYVQFVVLAAGLLIGTWLAIDRLGWETLFVTVEAEMGRAGFDPLVGEGEFGIEYVLWMAVLGLVSCAVWPTAVARALAMEDVAAVKRQFTWSSVSFAVRFMIPCFWGVCAFVLVHTQAPDLRPLFAGGGVSDLYAMPLMLGRLLPAGLLGLVCAAMLAAFMSTHDSYLLCWSSVITQDVVAPLAGRPLAASTRIWLTRLIMIAIGVYVWAWGLWYRGREDIWDYMAASGSVYFTGAITLLVGGLYWRRASACGAMAALVSGGLAVFGLEPLRAALGIAMLRACGLPATREAALGIFTAARVGLASIVLTAVVFVVVSLLVPDRQNEPSDNAAGSRS